MQLTGPLLPFCSPRVLDDAGGERVLDPACALVLVVLGDKNWDGHWLLSGDDKGFLLERFEASRGGEAGAPIGRQELAGFFREPSSRSLVLDLPSAVHGVLVEEVFAEAFTELDREDSGYFDRKQWAEFIEVVGYLYLKYNLMAAMQSFRAFFGRGQPWGPAAKGGSFIVTQQKLMDACKSLWTDPSFGEKAPLTSFPVAHKETLQIGADRDRSFYESGILPPGWWSDLFYYSANNHPIHGIFMCDPSHRISWIERVAIEIATHGYCFYMVPVDPKVSVFDEMLVLVPDLRSSFLSSLINVAVPSMIVWWLLYFLLTCTWSHMDALISPKLRLCTGSVGELLGYVLIVIGVAGLVMSEANHASSWLDVICGRCIGYVLSWLLMLMLYFNPVIAWGQPDPLGAFCFGDVLGVGQWRIEKQRFQAACVEVLRRLEQYGNPEQPDMCLVKPSMGDAIPPKEVSGAPSVVSSEDEQASLAGEVAIPVGFPAAPDADAATESTAEPSQQQDDFMAWLRRTKDDFQSDPSTCMPEFTPDLASESSLEYQYTLTKQEGSPLGIVIDIEDGHSLHVTALEDGPVRSHNATRAPHLRLEPGDYITEVNGVRGDATRMMKGLAANELDLRARHANEFVVTIDKTSSDLGMDIIYAPEGTSLLITKLRHGQMRDWNYANPDRKMMIHDRIISVNGVTAEGSITLIVQELNSASRIELLLSRPQS